MSPTKEDLPKFSVAVIGGGIGGLCLTIGLLEHPNIDVQVFESAHEFSEVGLGVNVAPNAQRALAAISPNTQKAFAEVATGNGWESKAKVFTTYVAGVKGPGDGKIILEQINDVGLRSVHRARFLNSLVQYIPKERAHFNKRLISIKETDSDGKLKLGFEDGTSAEFDCVVGADGIHSNTRKIILGHDNPAANPKYTGTACFRALIPMDRATAKLGAEYAQNCQLLCGPGAAIFSYPVEHGDFLNIIMMDFNYGKWEKARWVEPTTKQELERILAGWNETAMGLIDLMGEHDLTAWAMHDHPSAPYYNKGRIVLMGDAAHATTPFQGQGAGQAIEDALTLKTLLSNVKSIPTIRQAFLAFDLTRRARTQQVVVTSRHAGEVYGMRAENVGSDLEKIKDELNVTYNWMWNRDLDDQGREALKLFAEACEGV